MRFVRSVALALACLTAVRAVAAQRATGAIDGAVTDETGSALSNVTIVAQNEDTGLRRSTATGQDGRFVISGLPVEGTYSVEAALLGFNTLRHPDVTLRSNETVVIDFTLRVTTTPEQVDVIAGTPVLDPGQSTGPQTVSEELVRTLPLFGRDFIRLASLAPGLAGNAAFPSPLGQAYWTNNVLVDGATHFSKWRSAPRSFYSGYGLESIKEVQVLATTFPAEFGEALATITSAVTKAGTNAFGGSLLFFLQNDALNATPAFALRKPRADSRQFGFTLGGPFVRDRVHFLGSYDGRRSRHENIVVSPVAAGVSVPDDQDEHVAFFRVDQQVGQRHLMTTRYNGQFFRWHNETGGLNLPGTGTQFRNDVGTLLVTTTSQLSSRLLNEARFQFARYIDTRFDIRPAVFVSRAGYATEGGTIGRFGFGADPEDTIEAADTLTSSRGAGVFKTGAGFKSVKAHNTLLSYGRGAYFFAGPPDLFPTPFLFMQGLAEDETTATAEPRSLSAFAFVQGDWKIGPQLTVNLGLRYDIEAVNNVAGYTVGADKNNFQPRIAAAWDPTGSGRTAVRGGFGLYTQQQLLFYINRVQLEGPGGTRTISLSPESPLFPTFPNTLPTAASGMALPPRDIHRVSSTFHNPYSIQATGGLERLLFRDVVISADYVYLNGRSLMSLTDANAPASLLKPAARSVAQADETRPMAPVPGGYRKIITLGNMGESWYHGLHVSASRSTGGRQTVLSYTLARAEDMANYELPEDSRNVRAEKARASSDITHNLAAAFTWALPGDGGVLGNWSISGIGHFRSNRPYSITWGDDRNGTTQSDARPGGRNTGRTEPFYNVDLGVTRRFRWGTNTVDARVEAFNIFNTTNFDEYVGTLSSPLFARPVSAFPKAQLQLGAVVRF